MARTLTIQLANLPLLTVTLTILTANPPAKNHGNHGTLTKLTTLTIFCAPLTIPTITAHIRRGSKGDRNGARCTSMTCDYCAVWQKLNEAHRSGRLSEIDARIAAVAIHDGEDSEAIDEFTDECLRDDDDARGENK